MDGGHAFPGSEPDTIAALADECGFGHVSVQWDYAPQRPLLPRLRDELHARGLTFGLWESEPMPGTGANLVNQAWAIDAKPDHYVAQAETPRPWADIVADFRAVFPEMSAAIVTTFGGLVDENGVYDPALAKPIIDAGFRCLTESYQNANWGSTPARMDFVATKQLGWPRSQPTIGVWGGYPASQYLAELGPWPDYWVWLAETMTPADWDTLKNHNL